MGVKLEQSVKEVAMGGSRPLIQLQNVSVSYEDAAHSAVSSIDFQLFEGESVLLLGPSGSGKSTLALLCADVIPRSIEAHVSGALSRSETLTRPGGVGYVFQDPDAQFAMLTTADEIAFGLENERMPSMAMPECIQAALNLVGLDVSLWSAHNTFSGGMKQKLAIACAHALDPVLLVLDEPTANLDPQSSAEIFRLIAEFHRQGRTQIVIEHKFDALIPHMDRVVLFDANGTVHRSGPTQQIIKEEWNWMIETGVVAPWKSMPTFIKDAENLTEKTESAFNHQVTHETVATLDVTQPAISIRSGSKVFENMHAVWNDVSIDIPRGSLTAVVGPNGAGKSTLLQTLAGMERLTSGDTLLFSQNINTLKRREIGELVSYCFQNPEFQFIYERVAEELANRPIGADIPADVVSLINEFGLTGTESQSPFSLSQGQKRRLSVASMLRAEHEIYLLDEPTFGQDAKTQDVIMHRMKNLHETGKTIVLTTHDMDLVRRYATHVVVLAEGAIQFFGPTSELFRHKHVMRAAHLLDDVTPLEQRPQHLPIACKPYRAPRLNPSLQLMTYIIAMLVSIFASNLKESIGEFVIPIALMLLVARLSLFKIVKRISPFLLFYLFYIWSMTAYAKVDPGAKTLDVLWWHLSESGLITGLVLAFRMIAAAAFGVLFFSIADVTDFIVSLSQTLRIPPRFAYGILAGVRVLPLFQAEWRKLRQARQLRGKDAQWALFRPVVYAIPLLSQAIRMSERVAIAMEARCFYGDISEDARARTYFRHMSLKSSDFLYGIMVIGVCLLVLVLF